jgi:uncharacterized membrane protein YdbT with pleckstrin-like domain
LYIVHCHRVETQLQLIIIIIIIIIIITIIIIILIICPKITKICAFSINMVKNKLKIEKGLNMHFYTK